MSFDVNVGRSQPMIKPTTSMANNGGSNGNCGYMFRQKKNKQPKNSIFDVPPSNCAFTDCFIDEKKYMQEVHEIKKSWIYKLYMFFQGFKQPVISKY